MPNRKPPSCIAPAGSRHFYRSANLQGLRLFLWEDDSCGSVADYLRDAGAVVICALVGVARIELPAAIDRSTQSVPSGDLQVDAAVLNLYDPAPLARGLQRADIPFVVYTDDLERCLGLYPHASCVHCDDGPEALASAILLHTALYRTGLYCAPGMTVIEMIPRLRAMARFLVHDLMLADDLVAEAMEQAHNHLPQLDGEQDIGALLVALVERIWRQQKLSRPN